MDNTHIVWLSLKKRLCDKKKEFTPTQTDTADGDLPNSKLNG